MKLGIVADEISRDFATAVRVGMPWDFGATRFAI